MSNKFPSAKDYRPPDDADVEELKRDALEWFATTHPAFIELAASDTAASIDNRDAVRLLLKLRGATEEETESFAVAYDNGFYKKADGKSTPLSFMRVPTFMRVLGFSKDIVSVRHDYHYFKGVARLEADIEYRNGQELVGQRPWIALLEYLMLRTFGFFAYQRHRFKQWKNPVYGTDLFIPKLENSAGKIGSLFVWLPYLLLLSFFATLYYQTAAVCSSLPVPMALPFLVVAGGLGLFGTFRLYDNCRIGGFRWATLCSTAVAYLLSVAFSIWGTQERLAETMTGRGCEGTVSASAFTRFLDTVWLAATGFSNILPPVDEAIVSLAAQAILTLFAIALTGLLLYRLSVAATMIQPTSVGNGRDSVNSDAAKAVEPVQTERLPKPELQEKERNPADQVRSYRSSGNSPVHRDARPPKDLQDNTDASPLSDFLARARAIRELTEIPGVGETYATVFYTKLHKTGEVSIKRIANLNCENPEQLRSEFPSIGQTRLLNIVEMARSLLGDT